MAPCAENEDSAGRPECGSETPVKPRVIGGGLSLSPQSILIQEFHAGSFEGLSENDHRGMHWLGLAALELPDRDDPNP